MRSWVIYGLLFCAILVLIVILGYVAFSFYHDESLDLSSPTEEDMGAIRLFVTDFGSEWRDVSLLSPEASEDIEENYRGYVSEELLQYWVAYPREAPGRLAATAFPERLEIASITPLGNGIFRVEGEVIEVVRMPGTSAETTRTYPVIITLSKAAARMRVVALERPLTPTP